MKAWSRAARSRRFRVLGVEKKMDNQMETT